MIRIFYKDNEEHIMILDMENSTICLPKTTQNKQTDHNTLLKQKILKTAKNPNVYPTKLQSSSKKKNKK